MKDFAGFCSLLGAHHCHSTVRSHGWTESVGCRPCASAHADCRGLAVKAGGGDTQRAYDGDHDDDAGAGLHDDPRADARDLHRADVLVVRRGPVRRAEQARDEAADALQQWPTQGVRNCTLRGNTTAHIWASRYHP